MQQIIGNYLRREDGAVTVDYVVITAGVIGLCLLVTIPMFGAAIDWGDIIATLVLGD